MKITAHGYTHHDPIVAPDPVSIVPGLTQAEYDALVSARRDLWWTPVHTHEWWERPTPTSRLIGSLLAVAAFLVVLGFVGWVEGL